MYVCDIVVHTENYRSMTLLLPVLLLIQLLLVMLLMKLRLKEKHLTIWHDCQMSGEQSRRDCLGTAPLMKHRTNTLKKNLMMILEISLEKEVILKL